jgi:hypothetical protein
VRGQAFSFRSLKRIALLADLLGARALNVFPQRAKRPQEFGRPLIGGFENDLVSDATSHDFT